MLTKLMPRREIPIDALRDEAIRQNKQGRTWTDMARDAGYTNSGILMHAIGVSPQARRKNGKHYRYYAKTMSSDKALKLAEVLGMDPQDIGL